MVYPRMGMSYKALFLPLYHRHLTIILLVRVLVQRNSYTILGALFSSKFFTWQTLSYHVWLQTLDFGVLPSNKILDPIQAKCNIFVIIPFRYKLLASWGLNKITLLVPLICIKILSIIYVEWEKKTVLNNFNRSVTVNRGKVVITIRKNG